MTPGEIQEIRERVDKATAGPWTYKYRGWGAMAILGADGFGMAGADIQNTKESDFELMAAARTDIPKLLDHIEEQQREIERLNG